MTEQETSTQTTLPIMFSSEVFVDEEEVKDEKNSGDETQVSGMETVTESGREMVTVSSQDNCGNKETDRKVDFTIAANETKAVITLRVTLWIIIVVTALCVCGIAYRNAHTNETKAFEDHFRILSDKFIDSFEVTTNLRFRIMEQFALSITAYAKNNNPRLEWPFVTVPDFEILAGQAASLASITTIALAMLVNDENKQAYLEFAMNDTSQMEGLAIQQGVGIAEIDRIPTFPQIVRTTSNGFQPDDSAGPYMLYAINYPSLPQQWKNINLFRYPQHGPALQSMLNHGLPAFAESLDFIDESSRSNPRYTMFIRNLNVSGYEASSGLQYENDPVMPIFIPGRWRRSQPAIAACSSHSYATLQFSRTYHSMTSSVIAHAEL